MSAYVQTVVGSDSPPVGAVMDFAGNVEPSGWLFCFGQSLPRVGIYAQLFQVIGTLYGSVDGSSFSLPDFRGRIGAGRDNMGGSAANRLQTAWGVDGATLGANGGTQSHQLTVPQMPAHTHLTQNPYSTASGIAAGANYNRAAAFTLPTSSEGGDAAHPNVQPTFIVNKIIKYTVSGTVLPIVPGEGDVVGPDGGVADGDLAVFGGTSGKLIRRGSLFPRGHLSGLAIANNATDAVNDIDISEGECRDSTNSVDIKLSAGITKRLDAAWVAGTNQGGLDTGAIANVTYHVHAITGSAVAVDVLFSASATAPTLPTGYTHFRRIASVLRVSAAIRQFLQTGDQFTIPSVTDYNSTAARALSLLALSVPTGLILRPIIKALIVSATGGPQTTNFACGNDIGITVAGPQTNAANNVDSIVFNQLTTNTSGQIYFQVTISSGTIGAAYVQTLGWIDYRGRFE